MKMYEGRLDAYTLDDYLAWGMSAEHAEQELRAGSPRFHRRVYVHVLETGRRYPIVESPALRGTKLEWGYRGAGPTATTRAILGDLFGDPEFDDRDAVYDLVAEGAEKDKDFDLWELDIRAAVARGGAEAT